jgi:GNAT superfamily N-acetyltransferase
VVARYWNRVLIFQTPVHLEALWRKAVAVSGRAIEGLIGPFDQVTGVVSNLVFFDRNVPMVIEPADLEDAGEILALQKLAYLSEAEIHDDYTIPPLNQTLEETEAEFEAQYVLKATLEGRIVGSVRAYMRAGTCYIGKLIVHPDFQNRGIGTRLMHEIEGCFPDAGRYELFTGHKSGRNLYLYQKLGYRPFKSQRINEKLTLVFLEKC